MGLKCKEPPSWVQLQSKTMIRWVNQKLQDELKSDTPKCANPLQTFESFTQLQDGIVLIRLANQLICQVISDPKHPMNRTQLYYLKPLYSEPTFKLQKIENINDFLKFIKMIMNINVSGISADNIFDGDLKLILGLIWSLILFDSSSNLVTCSSMSANPSFIEIKSIISKWLNGITSKRQFEVSNFNKDWSIEINRPDLVLSCILSNYGINIVNDDTNKKLQNLSTILKYAEEALGVPHLIDIEDFKLLVPDEKCIITYLIEWYKVFEVNRNFKTDDAVNSALQRPPESRYNDLVDVLSVTNKLKNKYETKSLRFLNHSNQVIGQLTRDCEQLNELTSVKTQLASYLEAYPQENGMEFSDINSKFDYILEIFESFKKSRASSMLDLIYHNYPELLEYVYHIKSNLEDIGLAYSPSIKLLHIDHLSTKISQLIELDSSICCMASDVITSTLESLGNYKLAESDEARQLAHIKSQLQLFLECFTEEMRIVNSENTNLHHQKYSLDGAFFGQFCDHFLAHDNLLTHFELQKFLRAKIITSTMDLSSVEAFIKLIPTKSKHMAILPSSSSSNSIADNTSSGSDSKLSHSGSTFSVSSSPTYDSSFSSASSYTDEEDFMFDEIQQRLDSQLSGTSDKLYDIHGFIEKLQNGFQI